MDVTTNHAARHSENDFGEQLLMLIDSGAGVIHVRTNEVLRATSCIRRAILLDKGTYKEWDIVNGMRSFTIQNHNDEAVPGDNNSDIGSAFSEPLGAMRDGPSADNQLRCFVFVNPHVFMENNPHMTQLLLMYNEYLPAAGTCVIMVTPDAPLPETAASGSILSIHFHPPGLQELRASLSSLLSDAAESFPEKIKFDSDELDKICFAGAGMTRLQFETYVSLGMIKEGREEAQVPDSEHLASEVQVGKTDIVNSSDILELYPKTDIGDVGGMENLKEWINKRKSCYSDEAQEAGVEPPKGLVLVGVPGSGKSLVAKAVAGVFGVPLIRLDFGRVFSSYVGSSEQRVRSALRMIESMAPCVLMVDEIDKGLGGIGGGGSDSGVSMRVLGSFLTWLNDCTAPVFSMVTANNIVGLPPELLRRGRFDAIFSTSLPSPSERQEVFAIHLRKRGHSLDEFTEEEIEQIVAASDRYVPAELEAAVRDALVEAFSSGEDLSAKHITKALSDMVPLSKSFASQIEQMSRWAADNATPVSLSDHQRRERAAAGKNRSRISSRRRS